MAFIQPRQLGSGTAQQLDTVATFFLDGPAVANAHIITGIDITIPPDTYLPSLRVNKLGVFTPAGDPNVLRFGPNFTPARGFGPQLFFDSIIFRVTDWFTSKWQLVTRNSAFQYYSDDFIAQITGIPSGLPSIDPLTNVVRGGTRVLNGPGFPIYKYPDGTLHIILSVFRPYFNTLSGQFGQQLYMWYPFSLSVEVLGFQLSSFSPNVDFSNVSACVEDTISEGLYKIRPASGDLQSDFVETQRQAIRVAEQIEWQANMVLKDTFEVLYNPMVRRGHTVLVTNTLKNISHLGIVKSVNHTFDVESGKASTQLEVRSTEYIFRSALGTINKDDNVDQRAV